MIILITHISCWLYRNEWLPASMTQVPVNHKNVIKKSAEATLFWCSMVSFSFRKKNMLKKHFKHEIILSDVWHWKWCALKSEFPYLCFPSLWTTSPPFFSAPPLILPCPTNQHVWEWNLTENECFTLYLQLGLPLSSLCTVPCNTVFGSQHTMVSPPQSV